MGPGCISLPVLGSLSFLWLVFGPGTMPSMRSPHSQSSSLPEVVGFSGPPDRYPSPWLRPYLRSPPECFHLRFRLQLLPCNMVIKLLIPPTYPLLSVPSVLSWLTPYRLSQDCSGSHPPFWFPCLPAHPPQSILPMVPEQHHGPSLLHSLIWLPGASGTKSNSSSSQAVLTILVALSPGGPPMQVPSRFLGHAPCFSHLGPPCLPSTPTPSP